MQEFVKQFSDFYTLERIICRACNHATPYTTDPITDVACTMIQTPLDLCISTQGLLMFKDIPNIVLPFSHMRADQKNFLNELLSEGNSEHKICVRRNCIVVTFASVQAKYRLYVQEVLLAVCSSIIKAQSISNLTNNKKMAICNLIIQRIASTVHISHEDFVLIYDKMHGFFSCANVTDINPTLLMCGANGNNNAASFVVEQARAGKTTSARQPKKSTLGTMVVED